MTPSHRLDYIRSFLSPSMSAESTPLLACENGTHPRRSFSHRVKALIAAEGEPTWIQSYKHFLFGSYFNVLLLFVPLSFISAALNFDAALRFSFSFLAIIPLAKVGDPRVRVQHTSD